MKFLLLVVAAIAVEARPKNLIPELHKPYIIGGSDATLGQFKHQLSLEYNSPLSGWYHTCGAVLIGSTKVICAAHCTDGRQPPVADFRVKYGTITRQDPNAPVGTISSITQHPDYEGDGSLGFPNDISVFKTSAISGTNVGPIALPSGSTDFSGTNCTISGWGDMTAGGGVPADTLQFKKVLIGTREQCQGDWGQYDHNMHICLTGTNDEASCQGDSGGPCECLEGGKKVNAGVTSWGVVGCAGAVSVYTRVSNYLDFINNN